MAHWALPYLFFKAIAVPIGYLALAHARSRLYLVVESSYTLFFVTSMAICYPLWSYVGAGVALSIADGLYLVVTWTVYSRKFGFRCRATPFAIRSCRVFYFLVDGFL